MKTKILVLISMTMIYSHLSAQQDVSITLKVPVRLRNMPASVQTVQVMALAYDANDQNVGINWDTTPEIIELSDDGKLQHIFEITLHSHAGQDITSAQYYVCQLLLNGDNAATSSNPDYQCKPDAQCVKEVRGQIQW